MRFDRKYLKGLYKYLRKRFSYFVKDVQNRFFRETVKRPYQLIFVDPAQIKTRLLTSDQTDLNIFEKIKADALPLYDLELGAFDPRSNTGRIISGDWDSRVKAYDGEMLYESYHQHFNQNQPWENTLYYKKGAEMLEKGAVLYGCRSLNEFKEKRLAYIDKLHRDIQQNGYSTQEVAEGKDGRSKGLFHEISVNIGRNGELIYNNATGNNRLALSKVLKLKRVPVLVVVRHKKWEQLRKAAQQNRLQDEQLKERLKNHPDLASLGGAGL